MLSFPRSVIRSLRAVRRSCGVGRPRGPAPPVLVVPDTEALTWVMPGDEVIVAYRIPGPQTEVKPFLLPLDRFDTLDSTGDDLITLERDHKGWAELRWADRGLPRTHQVEVQKLEPRHSLPPMPKTVATMPGEFRLALHEAGRSRGRQPNRFAVHRVQLRGRTGAILATDAVTAYRHAGFTFPFTDDVLIPAIPIFGSPELAKEPELRLGRTDHHLVVQAGRWTLFLTIDTTGRFPDVESVIPKSFTPTVLQLHPEDAKALVAALPNLPGGHDDNQPVTLDLMPGQPAVVRGHDDKTRRVADHALVRSVVSGGPHRVALDRNSLKRAIRLGCHTIRVVASDKPVVAVNDRITFLAVNFHPDAIVAPPIGSAIARPESSLLSPSLRRSQTMKSVDRTEPPPERAEPSEPNASVCTSSRRRRAPGGWSRCSSPSGRSRRPWRRCTPV